MSVPRIAALLTIGALLAGCASVDPQASFASVAATSQARTGATPRMLRDSDDRRTLASAIDALLAQPLDTDAAVRIALLNHPGLQATYWELGVAQADLAQASRLPNPQLALQRTRGAGLEIERSVTVSLLGALTAPLATRIEGQRLEQARLAIGAAIERHAADTRRAFYEAVAARQSVDYARQVNRAAEAAATLSARMAQAGNASQLDLARERSFHAESSAAVVRAERQSLAARERLTRLLGLWGQQAAYTLPDRLPELPAQPADLGDVERLAISQRLDVQAARAEAAATASALGLTRSTRFINVLDLGRVANSAADGARQRGYALTLELPLFDGGGARVARAEALYQQALYRVADAAIQARSEARESYLGYRSAYDLARHYRDEVIPLRKRISQETLLRYNGMLLSTFELLADAREQATAVNAAIEAQRDFWIAHASLQAALGQPVAANTTMKDQQP